MIEKSCVGDIAEFLRNLNPFVSETTHGEWSERVLSWKDKERVVKTTEMPLHPADIMHIMASETDEDTIYATDVGQHQMWAAQYLPHKRPMKFITSGGLGTMGFGYGAAIGAGIGCPDSTVIHITGDGSFHMNMNEACTVASRELPVITVILNNSVLGMVYQWQTIFYGKRYSNTILDRKTDYVRVAEGFGIDGYRATTPDEFRTAIRKALDSGRPAWIDCVISREERVLPMIPGGKSVDDIIIN